MKKYIIFGIISVGLIGCTTTPIKSDNNKTIQDINSIKKIKIVDLDKKLNGDASKGTLREIKSKIIPISIYDYRGINDEVAFTGEVLKKADKIKIGANDEVNLNHNIKYVIKTSELKDGDIISLIDKKNKALIQIIIRAY